MTRSNQANPLLGSFTVGAMVVATLVAIFVTALPTHAADPTGDVASPGKDAELPAELTREEIRDLMAQLPDDQVRKLLLQQLDRTAVEHVEAEHVIAIDEVVQDLNEGSAALLRAMKELPQLPRLI